MDVDAMASQDYDALLFGAPVIIRNLSISEKRKFKVNKYINNSNPIKVTLSDVLNQLQLDRKQLIALGLLVGTDLNYGGIKGVGPKKGLKLVQEHGSNFEALFAQVEWAKHCAYPWQELMDVFLNIPTTKDYTIKWNTPNIEKLTSTLSRHGFSSTRIQAINKQLEQEVKASKQKGLGDFF